MSSSSYPIQRLVAGALLVTLLAPPVAGRRRRSAPPHASATADAALRAGRPDGRPFDGADHDVRRHAHRDHEPGDCRCHRRAAARNPDRRQGAGTVSLIIWGARRAPPVRHRRRSRRDDASAEFQQLFPGEDIRVASTTRHHPVGQCVEQRHDAESRRDRRRRCRAKTNVINLLQLPGGSESQQVMLQVRFAEVNRRAQGTRASPRSPTRPNATGRIDDAAVPGARLRQRQGGRTRLQRFSEPVPLHARKGSARSSRR